ncbi:MAG: PIN domain-containing protein, partial [Thermoprotei archaeon]
MRSKRVEHIIRDKKKITIVMDTNMLMLIGEGINVFEQIEEKLAIKPDYVVLKHILKELEKLSRSNSPIIRRRAKLAIQVAREKCRVVDFDDNLDTDTAIIEYALKTGAAVATNDRELRRKLREKGIPEIYLREESMRIDIE